MTRATRTLLTLAIASLLAAALAATAAAKVPSGFVGVMADGPIAEPGFDPAAETRTMVASGVESMRVVFHWVDAQPSGDSPPSFDRYDPLIRSAALRRIRVLPVLTTAPAWASKYPGDYAAPPAGTADYARFARAAVGRYGPSGSFWSENPAVPRRPIRAWQIWNEPNLRSSWTDADWAAPYVTLLRAAHASILSADPGARIVLAGLANYSWRSLAGIYRVPGARRLFDQVALHPYTRDVASVAVILRRARRAMTRNGDRRKPLLVTEFGWPSAAGKVKGFGIETTERGQARRAAAALALLGRERRRLGIAAVYWHNWISGERDLTSIWSFSGLRRAQMDGSVTSKPALRSFRRAALRLEDCRRKGAVATRCASRARN